MNELKNIIPTDLTAFTEKSYLNYSMYVILDRALPSVQDGLKPVQRRILYAMHELNLAHTAKYKKSARTIGDVLGKYHPHGDSACYEAMVMMAQPFNYRYPLVDGQGNWGSQDDPKSFAAMRYTEARLTAYASTLLSELKKGTTEFIANFDGTMKEPLVLPSQVPNILLNSITGIAVGMGTEIPSHNLNEVVEATKILLDNPNASIDELMAVLPAPDFASGGYVVTSKADMKRTYETGVGSVRVRSKYHVEGNDIVIDELPYKVQGERIIEKLADLINKKKLAMITDLRDESDHKNPIRIVISLKKNGKLTPDQIMEHLFCVTDLEVSRKVNLNMIGLNGKPAVKSLHRVLSEWIEFRQQTVRKRLQSRLNKINDRLHLIEGLIIAFLNLDRVISIIRESDDPKEALMSEFSLSATQADYILDTKLKSLARLEETELKKEQAKLEKEARSIQNILGSEKKINKLIKVEMTKVVESFGDERRSIVMDAPAPQAISEADLSPSEPITVVLSQKGWIRLGKGHQLKPESLQYKVGDGFQASLQTESNRDISLFDSNGRVYSIPTTTLPSAKSLGQPLSTLVTAAPNANFIDMISFDDKDNRLLYSKEGYGFICPIEEFGTRQKKGKPLLNCEPGSAMRGVKVEQHDKLAVLTEQGHMLTFDMSSLPELKKGKGNKLIALTEGDKVVCCLPFTSGEAITIQGEKKEERWTLAKLSPFEGSRGRKGKKVPKTFGNLISLQRD
ncbi:DNA topoisomerase IV subunit A [Vibrio harveyi]|uniref:DNA topoisomerase IV subunit A n=1 Tax=Vibrio harveyi TaxID=669 RepID=UPI003CF2739A